MLSASPIGVFDSGLGGLSVYRALRTLLPCEDFIYLGDTARLPYGTKSKEAVETFTISAARLLWDQKIKFLTVACNTISAQALDGLQRELPDLPYCGVISASAEAAVKATRNSRIVVLATEGTVRSGVYADIIRGLSSDAQVQMVACNLLVALVEEGWFDGIEADAVVARYMTMLNAGYDTLVLGCTHFPMLEPVFRKLCPPNVTIIDSATATAHAVAGFLASRELLNTQKFEGKETFLVTDAPDRFSRIGAGFLGRKIEATVV